MEQKTINYETNGKSLHYLKKWVKNLNETQVDMAELETTIVGLEDCHNEIKSAI